jgi:hypothetical protein
LLVEIERETRTWSWDVIASKGLNWARRPISAETVAQAVFALAFAAFIAAPGLPVLRHDWISIEDRANFMSAAIASLAWSPNGIGAPRPYPTDYLLAIANMVLVFLSGTRLAFVLFVLGIAVICAWGARALATLATTDPWVRTSLVLFALFNPWVYTEVVAGHLAMIGVYGGLMGLAGESLSPKPRPLVAALCMCTIVAQIQFFIFALVFSTILAVRRRLLLPLITATILAMPTFVGVALDFGRIASTPYTLAWQTSQSVTPLEAANLVGYFAKYTEHIAVLSAFATIPILILAAAGAAWSERRGPALGFAAFGALVWLWATGSRGPIAPIYVSAIVHFPALEIFRELYDLLGFLALSYVFLAATGANIALVVIGARGSRALAKVFLVPGLLLLIAWIGAPPNRFWVSTSDLPQPRVEAPSNTRVAFLPDVGPLSLGPFGSGGDPDAFTRPNNVTVLNGAVAVFPAGVALREYAENGSTEAISALSVAQVVARPWLSIDSGSIAQQLALGGLAHPALVARSRLLEPVSELESVSGFPISTTPPTIGSSAVFIGDASGLGGRAYADSSPISAAAVYRIAPGLGLSAATGWVDIRSAFLVRPELGQGIGGAFTTSPEATLDVRPDWATLVSIRGRLLSTNGRLLSESTRGYRWITLPAGVSSVRCAGECAVVAQTPVLPATSQQPVAARSLSAVPFTSFVPWLATGVLPPAAHPTYLRYSVGFDSHWIGIAGGAILPHVQVESSMNGWIVASHERQASFVLIEYGAALQAAFEAIGLAWTVALLATFMLEYKKNRTKTSYAVTAGDSN